MSETPANGGWTPDQPMVSIKDVHKSFGDLEVLKGVSMDIMKGECICIIGPSGSGKSTLIRCVNALNDIQKGSITVEGIEVNDPGLNKLELRKKVGMVFQQYNLFPHKTALENIMMAPIHVLKQDKAEVETHARVLIRKVRLEGKEESYPGELSGGMLRRAAFARSIVMEPEILLCDEPFSGLDPQNVSRIEALLGTLNRELGLTVLVSSHHVASSLRLADQLVLLIGGGAMSGSVRSRSISRSVAPAARCRSPSTSLSAPTEPATTMA